MSSGTRVIGYARASGRGMCSSAVPGRRVAEGAGVPQGVVGNPRGSGRAEEATHTHKKSSTGPGLRATTVQGLVCVS